MKNSDIYQAKRAISTFSQNLTHNLPKPQQKFIHDMLYGIGKSKNVIVTAVARALNEPISTFQTTKRLCRNLSTFQFTYQLHQNYLGILKKYTDDDNLVLVDGSDITKPYGEQFEGLTRVFDGSTGGTEKGYSTVNFSLVSKKTTHPIPIYSHLYSPKEIGFESINVETAKGFNSVRRLFGNQRFTYVMDRGYDSNTIYSYLHQQDSYFITRLQDRRYLMSKGKRLKVPDIANRRKGKINFKTSIKGTSYDLKISHIKVELPHLKKVPMSMVVVYGYGKKPMKLLTNRPIQTKEEVLRIVKAYITRWRIEELFRVQKEELHLESVRTLSLKSLKIMYRLVNYLIGHYAMNLEKETLYTQMVMMRSKSLKRLDQIKFHLYRFIRGMSEILSFDTAGLRCKLNRRSDYHQLSLPL